MNGDILKPDEFQPRKVRLSDYETGFLLFVLATLLCFLMYPYFHLSNLIMIYLLEVMITAVRLWARPGCPKFSSKRSGL